MMYDRLRLPASVLILMIAFALTGTVTAKQSDIRDKMNAEEFQQAGLDKLSEQELQFLSDWISGQRGASAKSPPPHASTAGKPAQAAPAAPAAGSNVSSFGKEQLEPEPNPTIPEEITARVKGEFRGWDGKTVFRLDNGQIWKQRVGGRYRAPKRTDPEVIVEKGRFGYYLKLVETGRSVGVKRIK